MEGYLTDWVLSEPTGGVALLGSTECETLDERMTWVLLSPSFYLMESLLLATWSMNLLVVIIYLGLTSSISLTLT
jgi:hypothetical protein